MSRLTRRAENGTAVYATPSGEPVKWENNRREVLQKLADYEDLEEQGLLLKLPCKLGTTVYSIEDECEGDTISCMACECDDCDCLYRFIEEIAFDTYMMDSLGKTVFLTKEAAEKALERLECAE